MGKDELAFEPRHDGARGRVVWSMSARRHGLTMAQPNRGGGMLS
jgi:hypothetical protein